MKKNVFTCLSVLMLCILSLTFSLSADAGEKQDARIAYVLKNLKLKGDVQAKFKPILVAYYKELSVAKAPHKALKDKYEDAIDADKLSAAQCDQLFDSKQKQEAAELALRKKFYAQFKTVLTAPQAYKAMKLSDDKLK